MRALDFWNANIVRSVVASAALIVSSACAFAVHAQQAPAQNVVLVMTDGFRWQEMFRGADAALLTAKSNWDGRSVDDLRKRYLADTPEQRRKLLLPFVWSTLVPQGVIFGDRDAGGSASVSNGLNFSYPGYSETLTGHPDPRVRSNDNVPNPSVTVFEWLNTRPGFQGKVAAFGAWEVFDGIFNKGRCGFPVNAGYAPLIVEPSTPAIDAVNQVKETAPHVWDDEVFDGPEFLLAREYLRTKHPRVLFLSLGETDDWAHSGNYGEYLESAHRADAYLKELWELLQSMPEYRGNTALLFTTDHGRGSAGTADPKDWQSHGEKIADSRFIWFAGMGPGLPASGVSLASGILQNQFAATLAKLLGENWNAAEPKAGKPLHIVGAE